MIKEDPWHWSGDPTCTWRHDCKHSLTYMHTHMGHTHTCPSPSHMHMKRRKRKWTCKLISTKMRPNPISIHTHQDDILWVPFWVRSWSRSPRWLVLSWVSFADQSGCFFQHKGICPVVIWMKMIPMGPYSCILGSQIGGTVWEGLDCVVLLEMVCHSEVSKAHNIHG